MTVAEPGGMNNLTVLGLGVVITMGCDVFEPGIHGSAPAVRSTAVTVSPAAISVTRNHAPTPARSVAPAPVLAPAPAPAPAPVAVPVAAPAQTTNEAPSVVAPSVVVPSENNVTEQAPQAPALLEDVELIELGFHHGDDVPESIGRSDWLALCEVGGVFELTNAALTVEPRNDPLLDAAEEKSGRQISAKGCSSGVVLLRGRGLVAGSVRHGSVTTDAVRFAGTTLSLAPAERSVGSGPDEKLALLEAKTEAARSVLGSYPNATIAWAGDLDRDGSVDFLVREGVDSRTETTLFLSSLSRPGELVGFAATTAQGGC